MVQGGATVFPIIKSMVRPQKGSAVFWYNLNISGEIIMESIHAACPVIFDQKWGNRFIHII